MRVERVVNPDPKKYRDETKVGVSYTPSPLLNGTPVFIRTEQGFVNLSTGILVHLHHSAEYWIEVNAKVVVS